MASETIQETGPAAKSIRFVLAGAWNTLFGYLAYVALYYAFGAAGLRQEPRYVGALLGSMIVSIPQAYFCHKYLVFRSTGPVRRELPRFTAVYVAAFTLNLIALPLLVRFTPLGPLAAQGLCTFGIAGASFLFHDRFSFRKAA